MIPSEHILVLAFMQFTIGLIGILLRRAAMIVIVSAVVMLNGVLLAFCVKAGNGGTGFQTVGVVVLALAVTIAIVGTAFVYALSRFRKTVSVDEHDQLKH